MRLQVVALNQGQKRTTGYHVEVIASYCLLTGVRPSTPELKLTVNSLKQGVLSALGLLRDTDMGDDELDELFIVDAAPEDAERVLGPDLREALREVMKKGEVDVVEIRDGVARIEWQEDMAIKAHWNGKPRHAFASYALADAVDVMIAIRKIPPTPLLKQLERRRKGRP